MSNSQEVELYKKFKEVSIAEFFEKNRHLLGFESPRKALYITVKELVDNSLDACEEARILPEVKVEIIQAKPGVYTVTVYDNGPGIPKEHVPNVFGKFLYGSKFHRYVSTRGKQGIGVSAVTLYAQLTTGSPIKVITKPLNDSRVHYFEIKIDVKRNEPLVIKYQSYDPYYFSKKIGWEFIKDHGTIVSATIKAEYVRGKQSVDEYITLTALANPHANIYYISPKTKLVFKRITNKLPELYETKPHPHGIEIGVLERMLKETSARTLKEFLKKEFASVGDKTAEEILKKANLNPNKDPHSLTWEEIERLYNAMQETKVRSIPAKYIVTLGEDLIRESLMRIFKPEFVAAVTRKPAVYRGLPFIVEAGIAYGGEIKEQKAHIIRLANRVPLLYKAGECAITHAVKEINWKYYGLKEEGGIPQGPVVIMVHVASVWIPFTSESKEAIAPYPEIVKEIKAALRDVARQLSLYLKKKKATEELKEKYKIFLGYGLELAKALSEMLGKPREEIEEVIKQRIREKALEELRSIILTVKDIQELIKTGKMNEAKQIIYNWVSDIIKLGILKDSDIDDMIRWYLSRKS